MTTITDKQATVERLIDHLSGKRKISDPHYPLIRAAHDSGRQTKPITRLVFHDEEYPVGDHSAEAIAHLFQQASAGGSANLIFDADGGVRSVPDNIIAWHAPPNDGSLGAEHDGFARFTRADWHLPGSQATLHVSALGYAFWCQQHGIPVRRIEASDLRSNPNVEGLCGHRDVSEAFHQSDHTDPGSHFIWHQFLGLVDDALSGKPHTPPSHDPHQHHVREWPGHVYSAGSAGPAVLAIQKRLAHLGFPPGAFDKQFGPHTAAAVVAFQKHHWPHDRAQWDGKVGEHTWKALFG